MAKYIDVEKLKPLLNGVLTEENEKVVLEGVMNSLEDFDEKAVQARIDEAVEKAKAEESAIYGKKLHDMFFGGDQPNGSGQDDTKDPEVTDEKPEIKDIFTTE